MRWNVPDRRLRVRLWAVSLATLLILVGWVGESAAFGTGGNYGPHVAYSKAADSEDGNYLVGGHLELMLLPFLGAQGAVDYRSSERFATTIGGERVGLDVRSIPITLSGRIYLPASPTFSPFLLGGAGWYRTVYDYSERFEELTGANDQTVTSFGWHLGLGAKLGLSEKVSLAGEARYIFVDPEKDLDEPVQEEIRNFDYNSRYVGVGLNVEF